MSTNLADVTVHSPRTRMRGVRADDAENGSWLSEFPACKTLKQHHIVHVGLQEAVHLTRVVRNRQPATYFLATTRGSGKVLIDGSWRICREGYACLLPAHTVNAFETIPGKQWEFCWVCYQRPAGQRPISDATSPVMARYDPLPLRLAVLGLMHESHGPAQPSLMQDWSDLIHSYVLRFAQPSDAPDQLRPLWDRVSASLADHWTLARLAKEAGYSNEHLRRLCQRQLGRSPMHQVTNLRMRRAADLLASTDRTIQSIALEVGYNTPFVFSNAFIKWIGWRPSEYRRKKQQELPPVSKRRKRK